MGFGGCTTFSCDTCWAPSRLTEMWGPRKFGLQWMLPSGTCSMSSPSVPRPLLQFSLQSLLVLTAMVAIGLGFYRLVGFMAVVHYCFLIFAVGPWFAYLASECLPLRAPQLRAAAANMLLLILFIATLKLAEVALRGPVVVVVALAAVLLWTPQ